MPLSNIYPSLALTNLDTTMDFTGNRRSVSFFFTFSDVDTFLPEKLPSIQATIRYYFPSLTRHQMISFVSGCIVLFQSKNVNKNSSFILTSNIHWAGIKMQCSVTEEAEEFTRFTEQNIKYLKKGLAKVINA